MPVDTSVLPELHEDPVGAVRAGLPVERFDRLRERLATTTATLLEIVDISASTLRRRRKEGIFNKNESDRLMRTARLFERAVDVFGDEAEVRRWLNVSHSKLGGDSPLTHADTEPGVHAVHMILGRIDHGIFS